MPLNSLPCVRGGGSALADSEGLFEADNPSVKAYALTAPFTQGSLTKLHKPQNNFNTERCFIMYNFSIGVIVDSFRLPIKDAVKKAAEVGAQGIQVYSTRGEMAPENLDAAARAEIKR